MTETDKEIESQKRNLWYIRRNGQIKGPYPCGGVRRFVLLGRVTLEDQVSNDRKQWRPVSQVPEVIPPEIRKALANGETDLLIASRLREDERNGRERRVSGDDAEFKKRRKGERRQAELEIMQHHRQAKTDLLERRRKKPLPVTAMGVVGALVVLAVGFGLYLGAPEPIPDPDCSAQPVPGVNWRNCKLEGVQLGAAELDRALLNNSLLRQAGLSGSKLNDSDMQYVDLSGSDLSYAELKRALMKGASLRNADLSYADLSEADLSFADLTGANFGGAKLQQVRLDNAIWIDGAQCLPGSVGVCRVGK
ncbi:pentapeptide repeat-containing protein [Sedimenticola hydrogenitrophicus]|uniref:pentapeptide repeat-containing protein n=1 Tax=Sedimenticola hydrogenitrophicus TaxID=2967975 RepID=UPI0021A5E370|nr:pentapeptide repeat-containing protein [Sedimenticola hydrogenitrophicus]